MPETSSSTRTRSIASRRIRRWSNARSIFHVEHVGDRDQRGIRRVRAGHDGPDVAQHREVPDGHDVHARIALGIAIGAELRQQARSIDTGLFAELAPRCFVQRLGRPLEATRDRPHPMKRRLSTAYEENVKRALGHRQDHDVHRHRECGELGGVVVRGDSNVLRPVRHASPTPTLWFPRIPNAGISCLLARATRQAAAHAAATRAGARPADPVARVDVLEIVEWERRLKHGELLSARARARRAAPAVAKAGDREGGSTLVGALLVHSFGLHDCYSSTWLWSCQPKPMAARAARRGGRCEGYSGSQAAR